MLHVVLTDGSIEALVGAASGAVEGTDLVCRNEAGDVVKVYHHMEAIMFGSLEWVIKDVEVAPSLDD